jgi:hypothetical protein
MAKNKTVTLTFGKTLTATEPVTNAALNLLVRAITAVLDVETVEDYETLTGSSAATVSTRSTRLNATAGGPYTVTLGSGTYIGQEKFFLCLNGDSTAEFNVTGTFINSYTNMKFASGAGGGRHLFLKWNGVAWCNVGGNAAPS